MANYAHIENNEITGVYDSLPDNWRNISNFYVLAENFDDVRPLGWRIVQKTADPTINTDIEKYGELSHTIIDDEVIETRLVIQIPVIETPDNTISEEEQYSAKVDRHNRIMNDLREKRNKLLSETDYTQLADIISKNGTELTQQFADYRQLLRDLPSLYESNLDFNDITTATFPELPTN